MPRNKIMPKILEILQVQAEATTKIRHAANYGSRQQFYSLLNNLKNQGLIEKRKTGNKKDSIWKITKKGLEKLKLTKENKNFSKSKINYKKEKDDKIKVVIFDIPEKERHKRAWLRFALVALGFSLLQQSVWIGKNKISEQFMRDLQERGMLSYIQIFEISKKGTIIQIS